MNDVSEQRVRGILSRVFSVDGSTLRGSFTRAGMNVEELVRLHELGSLTEAENILEIGFGRGTSSVVLLDALSDKPTARLTSIDPNQSLPEPTGFGGAGIDNVRRAGFEDRHRLLELPNYVALPGLVADQEQFDMVFIDGWHSFDYAFLDMFYADLLLRDRGLVVFHDSSWPGVYKAIRFLETHKPYQRLSPALWKGTRSPLARIAGRLATMAKGPAAMRDARLRRTKWVTLAAYRKMGNAMVPERAAAAF